VHAKVIIKLSQPQSSLITVKQQWHYFLSTGHIGTGDYHCDIMMKTEPANIVHGLCKATSCM